MNIDGQTRAEQNLRFADQNIVQMELDEHF